MKSKEILKIALNWLNFKVKFLEQFFVWNYNKTDVPFFFFQIF